MGKRSRKRRLAAPRRRTGSATKPTAKSVQQPVQPKRWAPSENHRPVVGINVGPSHVDIALRNAAIGFMSPLTDLIDEVVFYDPTASSALSKRIGVVSSLARELTVTAAEGEGVDPELAAEAAAMVAENLRRLDTVASTSHLAWGLHHGRSALEWHWTQRGGYSYPYDFAKVMPRRLSLGPERELRIVDTWEATANFMPQGIDLRAFPGQLMGWCPSLFGVHPEMEGLGPRLLYWCLFKRFNWRYRMQLTELFARGWRVLRRPWPTGDSMDFNTADGDQWEAAIKKVEGLGDFDTVGLPEGVELDVHFPDATNFNAFHMNSDAVDRQIQRLVNWNTGTDGDENNRAGGIIAQGQMDLATVLDAYGLGMVYQRQLAAPMCVLEYGEHRGMRVVPTVKIKAERERDIQKELSTAEQMISLGAKLPLQQLHERSGWREPAEDEVYVVSSGGAAKVIDPNEPESNNDNDPDEPPDDDDDKARDRRDEDAEQAERDKKGLTARQAAALLKACGTTVTADVREALLAYPAEQRARFVEAIQRHGQQP